MYLLARHYETRCLLFGILQMPASQAMQKHLAKYKTDVYLLRNLIVWTSEYTCLPRGRASPGRLCLFRFNFFAAIWCRRLRGPHSRPASSGPGPVHHCRDVSRNLSIIQKPIREVETSVESFSHLLMFKSLGSRGLNSISTTGNSISTTRSFTTSARSKMLHHLMVGTWTPPGAIFTFQFDDEALTLKMIKRTEIPKDEPISWMTFDVRSIQ